MMDKRGLWWGCCLGLFALLSVSCQQKPKDQKKSAKKGAKKEALAKEAHRSPWKRKRLGNTIYLAALVEAASDRSKDATASKAKGQGSSKAQTKTKAAQGGTKAKATQSAKLRRLRSTTWKRKGSPWTYRQHKALYVFGNAPYQNWSKHGTLVHIAAFTPARKPARGGFVFVGKRMAGVLDAHGSATFWMTPKELQGSYKLRAFHYDKDKSTLYSGELSYSLYNRTSSFASTELFVYADRGVYRPGEQIRLRVLAWRLQGEYKARAKARLAVRLRDPKGRTIGGLMLSTDDYGVASGALTLTAHAQEGEYKLVVLHEGKEEVAYLRVSRFRAPRVHIRHNIGRFLSKRAKRWDFSVRLSSLTGTPLDKGTLEIRILSRGRTLWRTRKTIDERGKKPYHIKLTPGILRRVKRSLPLKKTFYVQLQVSSEGRTDRIKRRLRYVANPYTAVLEADKDYYSTDEPILLNVKLLDLEGFPVANRMLKAVRKGPKKGKKGKPKDRNLQAKTDANGVATFRLKMGTHSFSLRVSDADGVKLGSKTFTWRQPKAIVSRLAQAVVQERKKVTVTLQTTDLYEPIEKIVHADVTDSSGAIIATFHVPWRKTKAGQHTAKGHFWAPSWGTMLVTFYSLGRRKGKTDVGMLLAGQQLSVHARRHLTIKLHGWYARARPGQTLTLRAEIKDRWGLREASVGAMLVDKGILSMRDPLEKTPHTRFYQPQLKTLSTTGAKMLTWPVVARNWGGTRYDIGLPPFRYHSNEASKSGSYGFLRYGSSSTPTHATAIPPGLRATKLIYETIPPYGSKRRHSAKKRRKGPNAPIDMKQAEKEIMKKLAKKGMLGLLGAKGASPGDIITAKGFGGDDMKALGGLHGAKVGSTQKRQASKPKRPRRKRKVRIIIRKSFPPTSFWAPHQQAHKGRVQFQLKLPDALTTQQLILVASDKKGQVGVLRKDILVTQPLHVRADLPRTMMQGDQLMTQALVRNRSKRPHSINISLKSASFKTTRIAPRRFTLAPGGRQRIVFNLTATKPGAGTYTLTARSESIADQATKTLFVHPKGAPQRALMTATLQKKTPASFTLTRRPDAYTTAFLSLDFPSVITSLKGLLSLRKLPTGAIDSVAGRLRAAVLIYAYLKRHRLLADRGPSLQLEIDYWHGKLLTQQNKKGSWGWPWWQGLKHNPTATASALTAMATACQKDFVFSRKAIQDALAYLWRTQRKGQWSSRYIAFWEGPSPRVRMALTAKVFHAIAMATTCLKNHPPPQPKTKPTNILGWSGQSTLSAALKKPKPKPFPKKRLQALQKRMMRYKGRDLLTLAYTARALLALYPQPADRSSEVTAWLAQSTKRLLALRQKAHWEPQWFDAWGGQFQATAAILQLLAELDAQKHHETIHTNVQYLLARRASWGAWHNGPGTAAVLEALTALPPSPKETASQVLITVNGTTIQRCNIDPKDPYSSAIALRNIELTKHLRTGKNTIRVTYNGQLQVPIQLRSTQWLPNNTKPQHNANIQRSYKHIPGQKTAANVVLSVTLPPGKGTRRVRIIEPLPASTTFFHKRALQRMAKRYKLLFAQLHGDLLVLELLTRKTKLELQYALEFPLETVSQPPASGWVTTQNNTQPLHMTHTTTR